jgi:septal ring factor EnvC (AmiA/AmiB activator)
LLVPLVLFGWLVLRFLLLVFAVQLLGCLLVFFSIATQDQALDNIEPQTQAANATNAEVIKIKKEVEQAQDNLMQAQQSVATLEKKILLVIFLFQFFLLLLLRFRLVFV